MSEINKFVKHSSKYFVGNSLTIISGLVSFPVFTRIFSVSDYGVLNLISTILLFLVALGKFGLQNAVVRFYPEFKFGKRKDPGVFYSTIFFGALFISGFITLISWSVALIVARIHVDNKLINLMLLVICLVLIRCLVSIFMSLLRVTQKTTEYNIINVLQKYATILLSIVFTFYFVKGLYGFYFGMVITEVLVFVFLLFGFLNKYRVSTANISIKFLREAIDFGFPLITFEFAAIILSLGDRFIIQYYMDSYAVGLYSAAYNLAEYIGFIFIIPLELAIVPIYMNLWLNKPESDVKEFLSKTLLYFTLITIPIIFGLSVLSKDIITLLASNKYVSSYTIVPYVITGIIIYGTYHIFAAGIFIHKKTVVLSFIIIFSGVINILLNIFLVPRFGILGSALATLLAYIVMTLLVVYFSFKYLRFRIQYYKITSYFIFGCIMAIVITVVRCNHILYNIILKTLLGALVYFVLIVIFDGHIRSKFVGFIKNIYKVKSIIKGVR